jgi:hypothetical protein
MPLSKRILKSQQHKHSSSDLAPIGARSVRAPRLGTLVRKMSQVISLRERVAQAELAGRIARRIEEQAAAPETIFSAKVRDDEA